MQESRFADAFVHQIFVFFMANCDNSVARIPRILPGLAVMKDNARAGWQFNTVLVLRMAHRIWKETKQQPGTAGPGHMLGCCLVYFHFMWAILSTSTIDFLHLG